MTLDPRVAADRITLAHQSVHRLRSEIGRVIIGQQTLVDRLIIALLIRGHVLLEGVPGLAKTLVVKTLAAAIDATFKRIQFTPDLLPADVTGTQIFDPRGGVFNARLGPVFANLILADEVNRAPAKVQSALLEAMQERQVTIGEVTYRLPDPFVVIATQNPIDQEGTYSLPEAQVDRFAMKLLVTYPSRAEEASMLKLYLDPSADTLVVDRVINLDAIAEMTSVVASVHLDDRIAAYIVDLVKSSRPSKDSPLGSYAQYLAYGASPRATLALAHVAKGYAFLQERPYVIPEDVKAIAPDVLRHRLILTYEAAAEEITADRIVEKILGAVPVP